MKAETLHKHTHKVKRNKEIKIRKGGVGGQKEKKRSFLWETLMPPSFFFFFVFFLFFLYSLHSMYAKVEQAKHPILTFVT
jgi:polyferredoxin